MSKNVRIQTNNNSKRRLSANNQLSQPLSRALILDLSLVRCCKGCSMVNAFITHWKHSAATRQLCQRCYTGEPWVMFVSLRPGSAIQLCEVKKIIKRSDRVTCRYLSESVGVSGCVWKACGVRCVCDLGWKVIGWHPGKGNFLFCSTVWMQSSCWY